MPNPLNIRAPLVVIGCGRTASTYVQRRLQLDQGSFQSVIDNDLYRDVWNALTDRRWTPNLPHVASEADCRMRAIKATRQTLVTMFPGDQPRWVTKMLWGNHDPTVLQQLFPEARFLHMVRDPRTNIPSMMERLQFRQGHAQRVYVEANECALQFEQFGDRYLRVHQEDLVIRREPTWARICTFAGVAKPSAGSWNDEVNAAPSTKGCVGRMRAESRMHWSKLAKATRACAERLGYSATCELTANRVQPAPLFQPLEAAPPSNRQAHLCQ